MIGNPCLSGCPKADLVGQQGCYADHGAAAENARPRGLRRLYLERVDHHLYYRVDERKDRIVVIALWHARRERLRL